MFNYDRTECCIWFYLLGENYHKGMSGIFISICKTIYQMVHEKNYLDVGADPDQYKNYSDLLNDIEPRRVKRSALANFDYTVWQRLSDIDCPALILGGSSDVMHNPLNVELIVKEMKDVQYIDLEINSRTHGQEAIDIMRSFMDLGEAKV